MSKNYLLTLSAACLLSFLVVCFLAGCSKKNPGNPVPVSPALAITSLSVNTGPFNTSVVITGTGFSSTSADDQVFFNGKAATIATATTTQLTATVPLGAGTGTVTLTTGGKTTTGPIFTYQLSAVVSTLVNKTANAFDVAWGIVADANSNLYVCDKNRVTISKVTPDGIVTILAGNGTYGDSDGTGGAASFTEPLGLTFDAQGNLLAVDFAKNLIRKITPSGVVTTLQVTTNQTSYSPPIFTPVGIAVDANNNIYVSNFWHITKLDVSGTATIFAGGSQAGFVDGGAGVATIDSPKGLKIDQNGNLFLVDDDEIRMIDKNGVVTTIAGAGSTTGYQDGNGNAARFNGPSDLAVDGSGNIYVADQGNYTIRKIAVDGTVTTVAGNINNHTSVDGAGSDAGFSLPTGICIDSKGTLYVTDANEIRKIVFE
jgi:sugar lactone lactonase YvrE